MPGSYSSDLRDMKHRERNLLEDYAHMTDGGTSHEQALIRLGMTQQDWDLLTLARARRDRR